ncbi:platelet-activating factor acetylhydrolase IB subunit gamma [Roseibium sp. TrichSKD4]|nr:platelet-activating factor acetylhydrolase IB subunit gamma [Roseibium sp. TrichSKD4]
MLIFFELNRRLAGHTDEPGVSLLAALLIQYTTVCNILRPIDEPLIPLNHGSGADGASRV